MDQAPDFVVAGAMRCGTTALYRALDGDRRVFMTTPKEPNYFATLHGAAEYCGPGDKWFAEQNTTTAEGYRELFAGADPEQIRGDASVMYLAVPGVEASLAAARPDCRVVVMLRDPVRRAFSAYWYLRSRGRERAPTFEGGLAREDQRVADGFGPMWHYVGASRYGAQLERWVEAFSRDQLLIVTTEDFKRDGSAELRRVGEFLGLEPPIIAPVAAGINRAGEPVAGTVTRLLYPPDRVRAALRRRAPSWLVDRVRSARRRSVGSTPQLDPATAAELWSRLEPDVEAVEELIGRPLTAWRTHGITSS